MVRQQPHGQHTDLKWQMVMPFAVRGQSRDWDSRVDLFDSCRFEARRACANAGELFMPRFSMSLPQVSMALRAWLRKQIYLISLRSRNGPGNLPGHLAVQGSKP